LGVAEEKSNEETEIEKTDDGGQKLEVMPG